MSLVQLIEDIVDDMLLDVHTVIPGKIVSYDATKQIAVVKPLMKKRLPVNTIGDNENNEEVDPGQMDTKELEQVFNVLVVFPVFNGGKSFIHFPLKTGDKGLILFTSRSIEEYILSKGETYPVYDFRHHCLSDAIFMPGGLPVGLAVSNVNADDVIIQHDKVRIELKENGKVAIKNDTNELLAIMDELIQDLISAKTLTMMGPQPFTPDTLVALNAAKTKLATLKV